MERNEASDTTKGAAALDRVKKLRRREPSPLPPGRRLQLPGIGCEPRDPPGLCRSQKTSPARLKGKMLIHPHLPSNGTITPNKSGHLRDR